MADGQSTVNWTTGRSTDTGTGQTWTGSGSSSGYRGGSGRGESSASIAAREAKAREERARLEREAAQLQAEAEKQKVLEQKAALIRQGREVQARILRDAATGNAIRQEIIKTNNQRDRVIIRTDLVTGEKTYTSYSQGQRTGRVSETKGYTASTIEPSNIPGKVMLRLSTGERILIKSSGRVNISGRFNQGNPVVVINGQIVQEGKVTSSGVKGGEISSVKKISGDKFLTNVKNKAYKLEAGGIEAIQYFGSNIEKLSSIVDAQEKEIKRLVKEGKKKEATKLAVVKNKNRNRLFGLQSGLRISEALVGVSYIPSLAETLYKNPKAVVPLSIAMWDGIKADVGDTIQLARTSPGQAVAKIGTDYVTFKIVGSAFKAVGKVTGVTARVVGRGLGKATRVPIKLGAGKTITIRGVSISAKTAVKTAAKDVSKAIKSNLALKKKIATIRLGTDAYSRASQLIETFMDSYSNVIARKYIRNYVAKGGKLGLGKEEQFTRAVRAYFRNKLNQTPTYSKLKSLAAQNKFEVIKLYKKSKILSAKQYLQKGIRDIEKLPSTVKLKNTLNKIRQQGYKPIKKIKSVVKKTRARQIKEIGQFKSRVEYANQLKRVKARYKNKKGWSRFEYSAGDYVEGVGFIENFVDRFAEIKAKAFLKEYYKRGGKLGLGKEAEFVNGVKKYLKNKLNEYPGFKKLKEASLLKDTFQIKYRKMGKIEAANRYVARIKNRIPKIQVNKKLSSVLSKTKSSIKKVVRKTKPSRVRKNIRTNIAKRAARKAYKQTNRYRMEKLRPVRKVTIEQLNRSAIKGNASRIIDRLFNEIKVRGKPNMSDLEFSQFKNLIKKRVARAIRNNDTAELNRFVESMKKVVRDMNTKVKQPDIKVTPIKQPRRIMTIKDFTPETPKGSFVEVRVGQQIMLQEVKQAPLKQAAKVKQVLKVRQVLRKPINLSPLIKFGVYSVSAQAFKSYPKLANANKFSVRSLQASGVISKQDSRVLQSLAQGSLSSQGISVAVAQAVRPRQKSTTIQRTIQKTKKKPIRVSRRKVSTKTGLSGVVPTYQIVVKQRGKGVRKQPRELTREDARDFLAYQLDNSLSRTGKLVATGKKKRVKRITSQYRGYYNKNSRKLREYKIKRGKKRPITGVIEKRKYFQDTKGERSQAARLRKVSSKRRVRSVPIRKMSAAQRKVLLKRLEKARDVRMRNLRRR